MLRLKRFKIEALLKFREDRYISLERPIIVDNVTFDSIKSQKNKIKVSFIVEAYSEEEAKKSARMLLDSLCAAFLLNTNIPMEVDDINIAEAQEPRVTKTGKTVIIEVHETMRLKDEISLELTIKEACLKDIIREAKRIKKLDERLLRFLRWYSRALLEDDPIDKFAHLWIALEIWAEYKSYKKGKGGEKVKMKNTLICECGFNEVDADEMYITRSKLFHSGVYTEAIERLP